MKSYILKVALQLYVQCCTNFMIKKNQCMARLEGNAEVLEVIRGSR